jgi:hypothetical protein
VLEREGIQASVVSSPDGRYPPVVALEAWLPGNKSVKDARERSELLLTINVKPYHEHELVVTAVAQRGKKKISVTERPDSNFDVASWVRFVLARGGTPSDYAPLFDAFLHLIRSFLPFLPAPHANKLDRAIRARLTLTSVLGWCSIIALFIGFGNGPAPIGELCVLAGVIGLLVTVVLVRMRRKAIATVRQPQAPPRDLALIDSWHAVVSELGKDYVNVKRRLIASVTNDISPGVHAKIETYTQVMPNGYEQRERLVAFKDQGMVHVHIYQFGDDIFLGWHAYLNWSQWSETVPITTAVRSNVKVEYRGLTPSLYIPNQFDLIDLASLTEFVHRRLERELKALLKEKEIEQEIDFKIIRGDRDRALDEERHKGAEKKSAWSYRPSSAQPAKSASTG